MTIIRYPLSHPLILLPLPARLDLSQGSLMCDYYDIFAEGDISFSVRAGDGKHGLLHLAAYCQTHPVFCVRAAPCQ